jgi:hypothetical protein
MRWCAAWLALFKPEPPRFSLPGCSFAALTESAQLLIGLWSGTTSAFHLRGHASAHQLVPGTGTS